MLKALAPSLVTHRDPKGLKFLSIVEAAYDKAGLSEEDAQRVNETAGLAEWVAMFVEKNRHPEQYAKEEISSKYGYPSAYKPKDVAEQFEILRTLFPNLSSNASGCFGQQLPEGAEAWFAIPQWQKVATSYAAATQKVLDLIEQANDGQLHNDFEGAIDELHLVQHPRSAVALHRLSELQPGNDILVVPAQFGIVHRGRSPRRTEKVMPVDTEFGLGPFEVGIMLLTHPERLAFDYLWIDCLGGMLSEYGDKRFDSVPLFYSSGEVGFSSQYVGNVSDFYGAATGFIPK